MKSSLSAIVLLALLSSHLVLTSATDWWRFAGCLKKDLGWSSVFRSGVRCAGRQMYASFKEMRDAKCRNCDKYFHCKANYNAVYKCGNSADARKAAEVISDCREFSQGGMDADGRADDTANRYGRSGGNCESRYLCRANCKYNPWRKTCLKSNC